MKLVRWTRFSWDLAALPEAASLSEPHYRIRTAEKEEESVVHDVIISAFSLDSAWADTLKHMRDWVDNQLTEVFSHKTIPCLVITHGSRIIGASALDVNPEAESHLLTGPCILNEYRNRGLGSALLHHSLCALREFGLKHARGITKENLPAAKFVYTKFNSHGDPVEFEPAMADS